MNHEHGLLQQKLNTKHSREIKTSQWSPPPTFRERVWRAVSAPVRVGIVVSLSVMVVAVAIVWLQPRGFLDENQTRAQSQESGAEAVGSDELANQGGGHVITGTEAGVDSGIQSPFLSGDVDQADILRTTTANVFVHVVGEVLKPGVVEVPAGSRVTAAIAAAGGATKQAVTSAVNLARLVVDGEQIVVPNESQVDEVSTLQGGISAGGGDTRIGQAATGGGGKININTADIATLDKLPGVGPALAQRILDWRQTNGGFSSAEQLLDVSGIGHTTLTRMRELVAV